MTRRDYAVLAKRYIFLCFGLALMALGIGFSVKAKLGTSPISSLPYVVSLFSPFTIGQATIAMHCVFIAMQIALLRRRFDPVQLAQLPIGIMFGYMIDAGLWALGWVDCSAYWQLWLLVIAGIVLVGTGVACAVASGAVPLAGEGVVVAVCRVLHVSFPRTKIFFDASLVASALLLSFAVAGKIEGVREGTLAAALCVGLTVKAANKFVVPMAKRFIAYRVMVLRIMEGQTAASEENAAFREEMRRLRAKLAAAELSRLSGQPSFSLEESRARLEAICSGSI